MRLHATRRRGFTLVELMVAAALSILIMAVLASAFSAGLESLSVLKSIGGAAERMRTTSTLLTDDLNAQHLDGGPNGVPKVSDVRYDQLVQLGVQASNPVVPPDGGFFFVRQGNGSTYEGRDQDQVYSTSADGTAGHVLGMCVRRVGKTPDQLFTADVTAVSDVPPGSGIRSQFLAQNSTDTAPANTYVCQWAEVYWFLANPQPLGGATNFTLYRRARLLTTTVIDGITPADAALLIDTVSLRASPTVAGQFATNTPDSIRVPSNRLFPNPDGPYTPLAGTRFGDDIVMTNVLSFEVKPAWVPGPQWQTTVGMTTNTFATPRGVRPFAPSTPPGTPIVLPGTAARGTAAPFTTFPVATSLSLNDITNGDAPFDDLPVTNDSTLPNPNLPENTNPAYDRRRVFDTWFPGHLDPVGMTPAKDWNNPGSELSIPFRARMNAVQIKVRAYDVKNKMTRQATVMVKL